MSRFIDYVYENLTHTDSETRKKALSYLFNVMDNEAALLKHSSDFMQAGRSN